MLQFWSALLILVLCNAQIKHICTLNKLLCFIDNAWVILFIHISYNIVWMSVRNEFWIENYFWIFIRHSNKIHFRTSVHTVCIDQWIIKIWSKSVYFIFYKINCILQWNSSKEFSDLSWKCFHFSVYHLRYENFVCRCKLWIISF